MQEPLTVYSWICLITFAVVIIFCIRPQKIPIPFSYSHKRHRRLAFPLDIATAPIIGILFLLATTSIGGTPLKDGIVGSEEGIQPYSVVILIFALAYICISIDVTGFFAYIAFQVAKKGGSSGSRLFLYLFLLSMTLTVFTSNDVVVLTVTPIVCYLTQETKTNPKAFLISTFIVCNIASMALYIGNPTNIIVAESYGITFLGYSAWMMLPTVVAVLVAYAACFLVLRKHIPDSIPPPPPEAEAKYQVKDKFGAAMGSAVLLACLIALMVVPLLAKVPIWQLTLPFAVLMVIKDVVQDSIRWKSGRLPPPSTPAQQEMISRHEIINLDTDPNRPPTGEDDQIVIEEDDEGMIPARLGGVSTFKSDAAFIPMTSQTSLPSSSSTHPSLSRRNSSNRDILPATSQTRLAPAHATGVEPKIKSTRGHVRLPTFTQIARRLPWKLIPFAFGMFILVEALSSLGWTARVAFVMAKLSLGGHMVPIVFFTGIVTTLACNLLNNLPMAILFARVFAHPQFQATLVASAVSASDIESVRRGGMFALIVGSNLGGNLTFLGSLAGLMWNDLLVKRGVATSQGMFFKYCMMMTPPVLIATLGILLCEFAVKGLVV
ncbi:arsenical pump membrane protein-domain-containing protein [Phlyctochytrium arcticum]|nr:arsenical pump membrane protein-domain-containing protein [Phlyctochytrium arcticum]